VTIIDRDPPGCRCGYNCSWPCWQRLGLTEASCCSGCPPIPSEEAIRDLYDAFPVLLAQHLRRRNLERLAELDATTRERRERMAQVTHWPTPKDAA